MENCSKMDKYYYFGEFGFLNLQILGGLERYFQKNPKKIIYISTYPSYGRLLKSFFGKKVKIYSITPKSKGTFKRGRHLYEDKFFLDYLSAKGYKKNITLLFNDYLGKGGFLPEDFGEKFPLNILYLSKPLEYGPKEKSPKYISLFPRFRDVDPKRNLSSETWTKIIYILKKFNYKLVLHGTNEEFIKLKGNFLRPKNVLEQIHYLNNSLCCICPDSGFAHFSLNCNCDIFVIGKTYSLFLKFNPFRNLIHVSSVKKTLQGDLEKFLKRIISKKKRSSNNSIKKIKFFPYNLYRSIRRLFGAILKKINTKKKYKTK